MPRGIHGVALLAAACLAAPAAAEESVYTPIDLAACETVPVDKVDPLQSGIWLCQGYLGIPVQIVESDLRFFVSYGDFAEFEIAANETLPPFNTINDTLEWRLDDNGVPIATILRFFTDFGDGDPQGQVLVVTALTPDGVCHAAYVDATLNANANDLARQAADLFARNFFCGYHTPLWIGERPDYY